MKPLLIATALLCSLPVHADTLFNYDGFYARMKKSEKAEFSDITLAFELQKAGTTEPCVVDKALITTDISEAPLTQAANGELVLPYDQVLNDNKALIRLIQPAGEAQCDLNFKLRSRLPIAEKTELKVLQRMHSQFDQLLDSLAGVSKYWLPEVQGLTLHFAAEVVASSANPKVQAALQCEQKSCQLMLTHALPEGAIIEFSQTPLYATPLLVRP
ncbi:MULTISPECIES: DUF2987 domain-containing protein [Rheinheimera]|uniref:DUF2987 domain-containing protein n=1 Tax=Rheinheimera marina TaxID=1774958 RepID=A0ABV9JIU3_9GAMM